MGPIRNFGNMKFPKSYRAFLSPQGWRFIWYFPANLERLRLYGPRCVARGFIWIATHHAVQSFYPKVTKGKVTFVKLTPWYQGYFPCKKTSWVCNSNMFLLISVSGMVEMVLLWWNNPEVCATFGIGYLLWWLMAAWTTTFFSNGRVLSLSIPLWCHQRSLTQEFGVRKNHLYWDTIRGACWQWLRPYQKDIFKYVTKFFYICTKTNI